MMRPGHLSIVLPLLALTFLLIGGCSGTYVNIPAQQGDQASHNPNADSVRRVMTEALRAVLADRPLAEPVQVELPEGTSSLSYATLVPSVGDNVISPYDKDISPASVIEVVGVRIRGWQAEVDITRPYTSEMRQLITVHLEYTPGSGWIAQHMQEWRGNAALMNFSQSTSPREVP